MRDDTEFVSALSAGSEKHGHEVVMITNDNERTAKAIGRQVGIDRVLAEVLPQDKAFNAQWLQLEERELDWSATGLTMHRPWLKPRPREATRESYCR